MRVFHDHQYAFPARAAAETIEEIRQPVLMQAAGYRAIMAHKIATDGGRIKEVAYNTNTDKPAVSQPTNAQWLTIFLKQAAGTSANRQNGNRVKNINAASIRNISEIFGDCRLLETMHLVDHANGGVEYRVSAYRAGTFSQP